MKLLKKIHLTFLRTFLKTPISTPIPSLYWETGSLDIESRINQRKLTFYFHILNMDDSTLARKIAEIQDHNNFPGLIPEVKVLLRNYDLNEQNINEFTKVSWKRKVKQAIVTKFQETLLKDMRSFKKINYNKKSNEEFGMRDYLKNFSLEDGRMMFLVETEMVDKIKFNFMGNAQYEKSNWACDYCNDTYGVYKPDTIQHVMECENYENFRQDLDLDQENHVAKYFTKVVKFRNNLTQ